ncbi:VOC family protein [Nocardia sp. ET3-3]|uniref:VOC family protein n=2 Tax=Nocardia terrae TaxID=2675851 RepID=A0A7K1V7G7_9NOCA|nr:VOC family protein [Nocardia terrae]
MAATHVRKFDHRHPDGTVFAVIMSLPGVNIPLELRLSPAATTAAAGSDPVTFGVTDLDALRRWVTHLDGLGIDHSPVTTGFIGHLIEFRTPDDLCIRLYTDPPNGFADVEMRPDQVDFTGSPLSPGTDRSPARHSPS